MPSERPTRVLLIEDDTALRRGTRQLLERHGHQVVELESGVGAEAAVSRHRIEVVITDLAMPEREGVETLRALKSHYPDLAVIVVTATAFVSIATKLGADRCFSKPVAFAQLNSAVAELAQRNWLSLERRP
jgi:DNA-binding NtrC family response regulator